MVTRPHLTAVGFTFRAGQCHADRVRPPGREVVRLVEGQLQPGTHQVRWDGKTGDGRNVPTGIYIARMSTPTYTSNIKMVLLK